MAIINHFRFKLLYGTLVKTLFLLLFTEALHILPASAQNWSFIKGYGILPFYSNYGTQGVAAAANTPGRKNDVLSWKSNGKFYMFGGTGSGSSDDLWEYDPSTNNWRWLKGSNNPNQTGIYGTLGIAAAANTPGERSDAVSWESNGKLYLFGGSGGFSQVSGSYMYFNDLWEYDPATNNWRWLKGSNVPNQPGTYGTQGIATPYNTPGGRSRAVSWESNGKLYLFGGIGYAASGYGYLNDLWEYDPVTNNWRWLKGSNNPDQLGIYGTLGIAAAANTPGARLNATSWESNGKLYLTGGYMYDAVHDDLNYFNDLWEYNLVTNNWRWLKGSNPTNQLASFGTQGIAAPSNTPGARTGSVSWENNGKLYLFGGDCYLGGLDNSELFNDLWEYDPVTNNWRWLKGSNIPNQPSVYGTQGIAAPTNTPGVRSGAGNWVYNGMLYLFSGGSVNDLWEYDLTTNNWRWLKGSNISNQPAISGTQGIAAAANNPGARWGAVSWENNGKFYLFGGYGYAASGGGYFNDLWEYDPATNNWRWLKGSNIPDQYGIYGTQGIAAAANTPGARQRAISWKWNGKFYLLGGYGLAVSGGGYLDDLWEYDPATNNWRWLRGSNTKHSIPGQGVNYGTQGIAGAANTPGARQSAVSWEINGKLYLFGGNSSGWELNDLWEYDPVTNNWRWLKGGSSKGQPGIYGTLGTAAVANTPGARNGAVSWESNGKLYLFGGSGYAASGSGLLNDLWEYDPATNNWRWLKGNNYPNQSGTYSTQGAASAANTPGARSNSVSWVRNGKLFLFGGFGKATGSWGDFNDLWEYDLATNNWRWLKGSNVPNQSGSFVTQGIAAPSNTPGAREGAVGWENDGTIYMFGGYGFGLDNDFDVRGDLWAAQLPSVPNDVAVSAITSVNSGCGLSNQETIIITVKNWGTATQSNIPVSYKINNGTPVNEVLAGPLAPNTSVSYTFTTKADLSALGTYNIEAKANLSGDSLPTNDAFTKVITAYAVPAAPTVFASSAITFCAGSSIVLAATSTTSGATFTWFKDGIPITGATSATYTAITSGNYTAVASANSCSSAASAAITVTVNTAPAVPIITAGSPTLFCSGGSVPLTAATNTTGAIFQWFNNGAAISGATSATYTANASGSYTVTATVNGCSSAASAATILTLNTPPPAPGINVISSLTICLGDSVALIAVSSVSGASFTWFKDGNLITSATSATYMAKTAGNYTATASANGCSSPASLARTVTINPSPATPTITQNGFVLTSSSTSGNQWYKDNVAISGATSNKYTATSNGSYTVVVTANGCTSQASNAVIISTTGLEADLQGLDVEVYPNPSKGLFNITLPEGSSYDLTVMDLTGKVIRQLTSKDKYIQLNINNAAKGVYILKIAGEDKTAIRKLIVK